MYPGYLFPSVSLVIQVLKKKKRETTGGKWRHLCQASHQQTKTLTFIAVFSVSQEYDFMISDGRSADNLLEPPFYLTYDLHFSFLDSLWISKFDINMFLCASFFSFIILEIHSVFWMYRFMSHQILQFVCYYFFRYSFFPFRSLFSFAGGTVIIHMLVCLIIVPHNFMNSSLFSAHHSG